MERIIARLLEEKKCTLLIFNMQSKACFDWSLASNFCSSILHISFLKKGEDQERRGEWRDIWVFFPKDRGLDERIEREGEIRGRNSFSEREEKKATKEKSDIKLLKLATSSKVDHMSISTSAFNISNINTFQFLLMKSQFLVINIYNIFPH